MRVIAGSARGCRLATFAGQGIRPTPDRVREALFSILYSRRGAFANCSVLDLYAGSGALGIEALSRGAEHVWFVDNSRQAMSLVKENLERCKMTDRATIITQDVRSALPVVAVRGPFDLIFADPPYGHGHAPRILEECDRLKLLGDNGIMVMETAERDPVPERVAHLQRFDQRHYGLTMLHFFQPATEEQA